MYFGRSGLSARASVSARLKRQSCLCSVSRQDECHLFGFTPSALQVTSCDLSVATAESNWNLRCERSPRKGAVVLIYEQQEGRGIGLMAKLQAYALQDEGLDTIAANHALGFEADCRDFSLPARSSNDLGIQRIRLLSNNPEKRRALAKAGIVVVEQIPCEASPNPHAVRYLRVKKESMGHTLSLV